jgi:hypothetical protein
MIFRNACHFTGHRSIFIQILKQLVHFVKGTSWAHQGDGSGDWSRYKVYRGSRGTFFLLHPSRGHRGDGSGDWSLMVPVVPGTIYTVYSFDYTGQ